MKVFPSLFFCNSYNLGGDLYCQEVCYSNLAADGRYIVYASVWHIPPPVAKVKADLIGVLDQRGRLVYEGGGGTIDDYDGRYSKRVAREAVALWLNCEWESNTFTGDEVVLTTTKDVEQHMETSPEGGFHMYVAGRHVPAERTFYLEAIYRRFLPNAPEGARPEVERVVPEMVPTHGTTSESDLKRSIALYLSRKYQWYLETDEIHLVTDSELETLRRKAKGEGFDW